MCDLSAWLLFKNPFYWTAYYCDLDAQCTVWIDKVTVSSSTFPLLSAPRLNTTWLLTCLVVDTQRYFTMPGNEHKHAHTRTHTPISLVYSRTLNLSTPAYNHHTCHKTQPGVNFHVLNTLCVNFLFKWHGSNVLLTKHDTKKTWQRYNCLRDKIVDFYHTSTRGQRRILYSERHKPFLNLHQNLTRT